MPDRTIEALPQRYARICGVLYLINIACGLFGEVFVRARLLVSGDAFATAHNIMASESLFRLGIAGDLVMHLTDLPTTLIFYFLLRPVNRDISLLAALFSMVQTAVLVANKVNLITALLLLSGSKYLVAFDVAQLQAQARLSLTLHEYGFAVGLIFFGVSCLMVGYLMFRSAYFPKTIGILQATAGTCYLINSFVLILLPALAGRLSAILLFCFLGELATCVWLIVKGVRMPKWNERLRLNLLEEIGQEHH
jgi:hypothetical protein